MTTAPCQLCDRIFGVDNIAWNDGLQMCAQCYIVQRKIADYSECVCINCGPVTATMKKYGFHCVKCNKHLAPYTQQALSEDASQMVDGLKCSTIPPFHLIPRIAYVRLAERVALGEATKGKDAWNAFSSNQLVLLSREALARRLGHAINHALSLLDKIAKGSDLSEGDDDAAALMWAGMYAVCSTDALATSAAAAPAPAPAAAALAAAVPAPPAPC